MKPFRHFVLESELKKLENELKNTSDPDKYEILIRRIKTLKNK